MFKRMNKDSEGIDYYLPPTVIDYIKKEQRVSVGFTNNEHEDDLKIVAVEAPRQKASKGQVFIIFEKGLVDKVTIVAPLSSIVNIYRK